MPGSCSEATRWGCCCGQAAAGDVCACPGIARRPLGRRWGCCCGQAAALLQGESWDLTAIVWQGGGACGSRVHMARKPWPAWGLQGEGVDQGQGGFTGILSRGERLSARKAGSSESSYPSPCEGTAPRPSVRGQAPRPSSRGTPYSALARIYARTYEKGTALMMRTSSRSMMTSSRGLTTTHSCCAI